MSDIAPSTELRTGSVLNMSFMFDTVSFQGLSREIPHLPHHLTYLYYVTYTLTPTMSSPKHIRSIWHLTTCNLLVLRLTLKVFVRKGWDQSWWNAWLWQAVFHSEAVWLAWAAPWLVTTLSLHTWLFTIAPAWPRPMDLAPGLVNKLGPCSH